MGANDRSSKLTDHSASWNKHRNKEQRRELKKKERQSGRKQIRDESNEESYILTGLKDLQYNNESEFIDEFGTSDINGALDELRQRASASGSLDSEYQDARERVQPSDDDYPYPEQFDNAVNDLLSKYSVVEEAIPAVAAAVARQAVPHLASYGARKLVDKVIPAENQENGVSKVAKLQAHIDKNYPTLVGAERWVEDGIDTVAKLEYYLSTAEYSDTHKEYWGFRPRGYRDRTEEASWDDDDYREAAKRLDQESARIREKIHESLPEVKAQREKELVDKHRSSNTEGGTNIGDVFSSLS